MKILHLSASDLQGGAARATYRLHQGLRLQGVDSTMLVNQKEGDDPTVDGPKNKWHRLLRKARPNLIKPLLRAAGSGQTHRSLNLLPSGLARRINRMDVDVVHLHWINSEMISIAEIGRIAKPMVWTFQDMWSMCGAEHYVADEHLAVYLQNRPPSPPTQTALPIDRWVWKRKKRHWRNQRPIIVTPSRWLTACVQSSALFHQHRVEVIPNALDTALYKPAPRPFAREVLNLSLDKKLILFGALFATSDTRKGFHLLQQALTSFSEHPQHPAAELVVFGASRPQNPPSLGLPVHYLGHIHDDYSLALLYSASDVMVVPSLQESFGQTASEALACGTPVVAFDATGLKDIVDHRKNGYLAIPYEAEDLARGIQWVIEDEKRSDALSRQGRQKVLDTFSLAHQAAAYTDLYHALSAQHRS